MLTETDLKFLRRSVELARQAVDAGDEPFGSVLVNDQGEILFEDHNHVSGGDHTRHPEFEIARWAAENLSEEERAKATVYTSGEHCPMCAAAHGWVGLGQIVYASSSIQLMEWQKELGIESGRVKALPIEVIIRNTVIQGPAPELAEEIRALHHKSYQNKMKKARLD